MNVMQLRFGSWMRNERIGTSTIFVVMIKLLQWQQRLTSLGCIGGGGGGIN